jgi:hypothetical protein
MSIYDFEALAQKFNLYVDTYKITFDELIAKNNNEYFACLIKKDANLHYVIVKKYKTFFKIYDSSKGIYDLDFSSFRNVFTEIIFFISKSKMSIDLNNFKKVKYYKNIKLSYLLLNLLVQIFIIGLTTLTSSYLNIIIN